MSPELASSLIAAVGVIVSAVVSVFISGSAWGKIRTDVDYLKQSRANLASTDQVNSLARDVAEIKGMFRITLKSEHGGGG